MDSGNAVGSVRSRRCPGAASLLSCTVVALGLAGCQTLFPGRDPFGESGAQSIQVDVQNRNFYDATIYLIHETGNARRLGDVGGNGSRSFQVPWDVTAALRIRIDLLASGSCTTAPMVVNPGDVLGLEIVPDFTQSAYCQ